MLRHHEARSKWPLQTEGEEPETPEMNKHQRV